MLVTKDLGACILSATPAINTIIILTQWNQAWKASLLYIKLTIAGLTMQRTLFAIHMKYSVH